MKAARLTNYIGALAGITALLVSLGVPAWAATLINGSTIAPSTITGRQVKDSSLTGLDVRNATVAGIDVRNSSLTGADVRNGSIDTADVKDASLTSADLAPGAVSASAIATGSIASAQLADGSVTTAKFASDAVAPSALALPGLRTESNATSPNIVGGSTLNTVTSGVVGAVVGGGGVTSFTQKVTDNYGTVAGGRGNTAGDSAGATDDVIAATVGGGEGNTATGSYATIPGGLSNSAAMFSFAAGRRAKAVNTGSFVWADSTNADYTSTTTNQFAIRASNGMVIANDAGGAKVVPVGTRYRDNAIVAWGRVTAAAGLDTNFNVASVVRATNNAAATIPAGAYRITLNSSLSSGFSLVPVVTPELDPDGLGNPPTGAANMRFAVTNQVAAGNTFDVYIYNGSGALVDNDFQVVVTGR